MTASTASQYGLAWDEPHYFHAADLHVNWLYELVRNILSGQIERSLSDEIIIGAWHSDPYYVPHPPFSRIASGFSNILFSGFVDRFSSYRLASALFFATLVTTIYVWMSRIFDRLTGFVSGLLALFLPNLFGFAHLAVTDMPLTAIWFFSAYCFWRGLDDWKWSVITGVVWGLALSTKFPALLIPIPLMFWAHLCQRKNYQNNLFSMVFLGPAVMIGFQPYLWHHTVLRVLEFCYEGASRGYRPETNFSVFFRHGYYASSELPWYYGFFMTAVTVPETILFFSCMGVIAMFSLTGARRKLASLFALHGVFILILGLFPGAVLHDVNRQMLPALPYLASLSGCGFFFLSTGLKNALEKKRHLQSISYLKQKITAALLAVTLVPPLVDLITYHPYELSYFNRLVGGISGAYQRGLEVTYFMEAFTPDFLGFLNRTLPANSTINASFANFIFRHYRKEKLLRQDINISDHDGFDFYVLLNRRSAFSEKDSFFLNTRSPYNAFRLHGVPLILIYKNLP